jgi:hypothetical protein
VNSSSANVSSSVVPLCRDGIDNSCGSAKGLRTLSIALLNSQNGFQKNIVDHKDVPQTAKENPLPHRSDELRNAFTSVSNTETTENSNRRKRRPESAPAANNSSTNNAAIALRDISSTYCGPPHNNVTVISALHSVLLVGGDDRDARLMITADNGTAMRSTNGNRNIQHSIHSEANCNYVRGVSTTTARTLLNSWDENDRKSLLSSSPVFMQHQQNTTSQSNKESNSNANETSTSLSVFGGFAAAQTEHTRTVRHCRPTSAPAATTATH